MSVLSDRTIRELCVPPTHFVYTSHERNRLTPAWSGHSHNEDQLADLVNRYHAQVATPETLKEFGFEPMITPFVGESIKRLDTGEACASYGVSSFGYDIRAAAEFKVFRGMTADGRIDYKRIDDSMFETIHAPDVWIPPNGFILARSVERVKIPKDVLAICIGKSTIARVGINCLCTPIEPGWEGYITLEFSNSTNLPNRFYANEGVLQLVFLRGDRVPAVTYADRDGKYMNQGDQIILPRV